MNGSKFPVDFDAVAKGDSWSQDEVLIALGVPLDCNDPAFHLMKFCQRVSEEMKDRQQVVTVAIQKGRVRILTDEEAVEYNAREFDRGLAKSRRAHFRALAVDVGNIGEVQREQHERRCIVNGQVLSAIRKTRRIAVSAVERSTPKLG